MKKLNQSDIMETAMFIPSRLTRSRLAAAFLAVSAASAFGLSAEEPAVPDKGVSADVKTPAAPVAEEKKSEAPAAAGDEKQSEAMRLQAETQVEADKREKTGDEYYKMANEEFIQGNFLKASEFALQAIEIFRDGKDVEQDGLLPEETQKKLQSAKNLLSKSYYQLALSMFYEAEKSARADLYDEAVAKCEEAVKCDPDNEEIKTVSEALIKKFTRLKEANEYNDQTSITAIDEQSPERQLTIEREMRKGQQFYKTGQWAKARDHFQAVLIEDPYNEMATDYLRRCFLKLIEVGRRRHDVVTLERDAETGWKSVNAIVSSSASEEAEALVDGQIKVDDTKNIEGKLKTIMIPTLDFEDQTLQDVVAILRRRSQELDPDKNGVNILLFLSDKPPKAKTESEEGDVEDSFDASAAEEDMSEEDSSWDEDADADAEEEDSDSSTDEEESSDTDSSGSVSESAAAPAGRSRYMIDYLKVDNVDLRQAIQHVCEAAGVRYRVEPYAVIIADENVPLDECELKVFVVEKEVLESFDAGDSSDSSSSNDSETDANSQMIKKFFQTRGVPFPANAAIKFDEAASRLIVSNTPEALQMIGEILEQLSNEQTTQVLVQVKFVEVSLNDLEELGFEYVLSRTTNGKTSVYTTYQQLGGTGNEVPGVTYNSDGKLVYTNNDSGYTLVYRPANESSSTSSLSGVSVAPATPAVSTGETLVVNRGDTVTVDVTSDAESSPYYVAPLNMTSIYGKSVTFGPNSQLVRNAKDDTSAFTKVMTVDNDTVLSWSHSSKQGYDISAKVHALDQAESTDILSAPRVTTLANEDAVIKMTTNKYYPDEWNDATIETVTSNGRSIPVFQPSIPTFGDATEEGIVLNVRPQVEDNFTITLVMTPVIQNFVGWTDYSYQLPLESNGVTKYYPNVLKKPIIEARTVETTVVSYDGETIVLGGVINDSISIVEDQYPILGDIPLVGRLFQSKGRGSEKVNLLIFMTSRLIKPDGTPIRENEERGIPNFPY